MAKNRKNKDQLPSLSTTLHSNSRSKGQQAASLMLNMQQQKQECVIQLNNNEKFEMNNCNNVIYNGPIHHRFPALPAPPITPLLTNGPATIIGTAKIAHMPFYTESRRSVGYFWDLENIRPSHDCDVPQLMLRIRSIFDPRYYVERQFEVVCDVKNYYSVSSVMSDLDSAQATIVHCSGRWKNAADEKIKNRIIQFASTFPGAVVVLISSDANYSNTLETIRRSNDAYVVLIYRTPCNDALINVADAFISFEKLTKGMRNKQKSIHASTYNYVRVVNLPNKIYWHQSVENNLNYMIRNTGGKIRSIDFNLGEAIISFLSRSDAERAATRITSKLHKYLIVGTAFQTIKQIQQNTTFESIRSLIISPPSSSQDLAEGSSLFPNNSCSINYPLTIPVEPLPAPCQVGSILNSKSKQSSLTLSDAFAQELKFLNKLSEVKEENENSNNQMVDTLYPNSFCATTQSLEQVFVALKKIPITNRMANAQEKKVNGLGGNGVKGKLEMKKSNATLGVREPNLFAQMQAKARDLEVALCMLLKEASNFRVSDEEAFKFALKNDLVGDLAEFNQLLSMTKLHDQSYIELEKHLRDRQIAIRFIKIFKRKTLSPMLGITVQEIFAEYCLQFPLGELVFPTDSMESVERLFDVSMWAFYNVDHEDLDETEMKAQLNHVLIYQNSLMFMYRLTDKTLKRSLLNVFLLLHAAKKHSMSLDEIREGMTKLDNYHYAASVFNHPILRKYFEFYGDKRRRLLTLTKLGRFAAKIVTIVHNSNDQMTLKDLYKEISSQSKISWLQANFKSPADLARLLTRVFGFLFNVEENGRWMELKWNTCDKINKIEQFLRS